MKRFLLVTTLVFIALTGALAQGVTTASISGVVTDQKGESLPGATVVAIHQPSGTQYGTTTRPDGRFVIPNARIGGPYQVKVSFVGFSEQVKEGLFLNLGVTSTADFQLQEQGTELEAITITGSSIINPDRTGAITNISNRQIQQLPTLSRSFNDYVRLTPQANGTSFAGRSNGYNNITVDGALFNNAFGLSGTVGGQANAQPISLDAVDQITTSIAPYDVREGSFTGAGVNVVTRSGTNNFEGSVYHFFRNEGFVNDKVRNLDNKFPNFDVKNYGFRLGGPIVKDKVFFFVNYELERRTDPATTFVASRPGLTGDNVSAVQASDLDALSSFIQERYNFSVGPYENYNRKSDSDKAAVKLDWNISANHKLTLKYNYLRSYQDVVPSNSGSIVTRSPNVTGMPFYGIYYRINNNLDSYIAELNSNFGNKYANKFQVGYSQFRDFRESPTGTPPFPTVDIGNGTGGFLTTFGFEPFSANNILNTDVIQISDNFDMFLGKHTVSVGTYNEIYSFENGFSPNYYGLYRFNSLADFYASARDGVPGRIANYQLSYSASPDGSFPLAKINPYQLGFYAQDKYEFNRQLNVTLGLRVDVPVINADIARNEQAASFTFRDGATIETDKVQNSQLLWSPRLGFNYDVLGDQTLQIRGGSGIFTGRVPYVWITNQAGNNGVLFGSKVYSAAELTTLVFNGDVDAYRPGRNGNPPASASANYNLAVTDRDFKFPQVWRSNIAVDKIFAGGLTASVDFAYTKDINAVYHQNINLPNAPSRASGSDTRPIFYTTFPFNANPVTTNPAANPTTNTRINTNISDAILMKNTNEGYSYFITGQVKKTFGFGLDAMVAYTYTQSESVNDGGSIAQSIWRDRQVSGDPNQNVMGYFQSLLRHRVIASVNYRKEYLQHFATSVGLFYEYAPGGRFSYVYAGDMNGDNAGGNNDLIYIPRDRNDIALVNIVNSDGSVYSADEQWADLDAYISQDRYLKDRRGQYAERNGAYRPFFSQLDFRLLQDLYIDVKGKRNTLQLSIDIFNFGNMLNTEWSVSRTPNRTNLIEFRGYNAQGVPQFRYPYLNNTTRERLTQTFRDDLGLASRWQMQIGLRYIFGN